MQLYWVDLAIIGIIAVSAITGLIRGFVKELVALFVWVAGIWIAYNYSPGIDPWLAKYIQDKTIRSITAFMIIFVAAILIGGIFNAVLSFILKRSGLSGTDRTLGTVFGFVRGIFMVSLIIVVIKMTSLPDQEYAKESRLYVKFDPVVNWLHELMPDFIKKAKLIDEGHSLADLSLELKNEG